VDATAGVEAVNVATREQLRERLEYCRVCWHLGTAYFDGKVWRVRVHPRPATSHKVCRGSFDVPARSPL
jgi:hypothetical protein